MLFLNRPPHLLPSPLLSRVKKICLRGVGRRYSHQPTQPFFPFLHHLSEPNKFFSLSYPIAQRERKGGRKKTEEGEGGKDR